MVLQLMSSKVKLSQMIQLRNKLQIRSATAKIVFENLPVTDHSLKNIIKRNEEFFSRSFSLHCTKSMKSSGNTPFHLIFVKKRNYLNSLSVVANKIA